MIAETKCKNCGKWSKWEQKLEDTCEHCGAILKEEELKRANLAKENRQKELDEWIFTIRENDNALIILLKKIGNIAYLIYMGILGFIAWVIAALPG